MSQKIQDVLKGPHGLVKVVIDSSTGPLRQLNDAAFLQTIPKKNKKDDGTTEIVMTDSSGNSSIMIALLKDKEKKEGDDLNAYTGTYAYTNDNGITATYRYYNAWFLFLLILSFFAILIPLWVLSNVVAAIVIITKWRRNREKFNMAWWEILLNILFGPVYLTDQLVKLIFWQYF